MRRPDRHLASRFIAVISVFMALLNDPTKRKFYCYITVSFNINSFIASYFGLSYSENTDPKFLETCYFGKRVYF
jgi:hypothetical protein